MSMCPGRVWRDWCRDLDTDLEVIRNQNVNVVASIITHTELLKMNYTDFYDRILTSGLESIELSIHDKWLPNSVENFMKIVNAILEYLRQEKTVLIHCNGGRGRTGLLVSACIFYLGYPTDQAIQKVRTARTGMLRNPAQEIFLRSILFKPILEKLSPRVIVPKLNLPTINLESDSSNLSIKNPGSQSNTPRTLGFSHSPKSNSPKSRPTSPRKKQQHYSPRSLLQSVLGGGDPNITEIPSERTPSPLNSIRASAEIPFLFLPVSINNVEYNNISND